MRKTLDVPSLAVILIEETLMTWPNTEAAYRVQL